MTNANDHHDFRQFAGRFDQSVAPSPIFAAELRQRLAMVPKPAPAPIQPVATPIDTVSPERSSDDMPWRAPRWMRAIEAAVAVLLVVSLAGASLYFRQPEAVYDLAFQPAHETPPTEYNFGGDAGRTWVMGHTEPEMDGFRQDPTIDLGSGQFDGPAASGILVDNSYVFTVSGLEQEELVRYELDSRERAWTAPMYITGTFASDGERIFGFRADRMSRTESARLVAIDFETGEVVWEGPELANRFITSSSLTLSGDTVFGTDYLGNTVAVNKTDGALLWQYPETFAVPSADEHLITGPQM